MRRLTIICCLVLVTAVPAGAQVKFSLRLNDIPLRPISEQTRARLAEWNSPMGRLEHMLGEQRAGLGREGLPGAGSLSAVAIRVKMQGGIPLHLVTAAIAAGIQLDERKVPVVHWPWAEESSNEPALPLDEQISILLGHRLEVH